MSFPNPSQPVSFERLQFEQGFLSMYAERDVRVQRIHNFVRVEDTSWLYGIPEAIMHNPFCGESSAISRDYHRKDAEA